MTFRRYAPLGSIFGALFILTFLIPLAGILQRAAAQVADVRVVNESAPAGGLAVVQIELTDPEPIIAGRFAFTFPSGPLREIRGVGLFSEQFDVIGAARIRPGRADVSFASFSARMGLSEELPIFVVAMDVDSNAVTGATSQLVLDPNQLQLVNPSGQPYQIDLKPGGFTVGGLSLNSVTPSQGVVPAGTTLVFRGVGFDPDADLDIEGVALNNVEVISAAEIRAVAGQTFRIEGRRIRIRNKDADEEEFFFVFTPTTKIETTTDPLLNEIVPIFDDTTLTTGVLRNVDSGAGAIAGVAFQNAGSQQAEVTVQVFDGSELFLGQTTIHLSPGQRSLHEVSELVSPKGFIEGGVVGVLSTQPLGMLGLLGFASDATLDPIPFSDEELPDIGPPTPTINEGGVVLATLTPTVDSIAPRSIATAFGQNFAPPGTRRSAMTADLVNGLLPTELAGVCVEVAGVRAPLLFASSEQLNFQVPDVAIKGPVALEVIAGCGAPTATRSGIEITTVAEGSPGFFLLRLDGSNGANPVAALHGGGPTVVGDPGEVPNASPATPGEFVSLFGTGFGATSPPIRAGEIPSNRMDLRNGEASITSDVSVTIGGTTLDPEDIFYAGVAPCCAGLDQLVIKVPDSAATGNLAVSATVDGRTTPQGPYLTVQGP